METRAHFTVIGALVVAFIVGVFGFIYWLQNAGGFSQQTAYEVRFEEPPVGGLASLSAVLFNGVRVGNVVGLKLDPRNPRTLIASITVDPSTPIRTDTKVELSYQGFTGAPVLALSGGAPDAPRLTSANGRPPMLTVKAGNVQNLTDAAREAVSHFDSILTANEKPLHTAIDGISQFADMLGRNSKRVEDLLGGLEKLTGTGAAAKPPTSTFDLDAPSDFPGLDKEIGEPTVVADPNATLVYDTQKVLIKTSEGTYTDVEGAIWADNLPKLMQAKIVQSFENAKQLKAVSRPIDSLEAEYKIEITIRSFQISPTPQPSAVIELAVRLLDAKGAVKDARIFKASEPAQGIEGRQAIDALNKAFVTIARELVIWTAGAV
jgi:phospholipid/cholesterol/gamma-HCH transport system substrate-binding protein